MGDRRSDADVDAVLGAREGTTDAGCLGLASTAGEQGFEGTGMYDAGGMTGAVGGALSLKVLLA